jgi:curved DNA-binding protein CbpA
MSIDYYEILGVTRSANEAKIKLAYKLAAQHAHPDRGGDREVFDQISEAYAVLSDPISRADYDKHGNVDPLLTEAIEKLQTHMVGIIANMEGDYIGALNHNVKEYRKKLIQLRNQTKNNIKRFTKARDVIKSKHSRNIFKEVIDKQIDQLRGELDDVKKKITTSDKMLDILLNYETIFTNEVTNDRKYKISRGTNQKSGRRVTRCQ